MRSDAVKKGMQTAPQRSLFNALGITEEELLGMPKGAALVTICRRLHLIRGEYK